MRRVALAASCIAIALAGCGDDDGGDDTNGTVTEATGPASEADRALAIEQANAAYDRAKSGGFDLESGPCIAETVQGLPDWVVDVAHDPRQPVDDDPANQCKRFNSGKASHVVELTPEGELIRAE